MSRAGTARQKAIASPGIVRRRPPAAVLLEETEAIHEATGDTPLVSTSLLLAAWRGQETRVLELSDASIQDAAPADVAKAICLAQYAAAVLYNGLGRYRAAFAPARRSCASEHRLSTWALPELVEASTRSGRADVAAVALRRLEEHPRVGDAAWALAIRIRSRALVSPPELAGALYDEALERLDNGRLALQVARTQLLYGEWLRREGRRVDAREQLRPAHRTFDRIGAEGFAERARRELVATGATVRKRTVDARNELTAQEVLIGRLAAAGYTNPEIATELFISPRTVEWHLRKVFPKLGITSRKQLRRALANPAPRPRDRVGAAPAAG